MVKDFIITKEFCDFCPNWEIAKVLTQADIEIIDVNSGDPRVKSLEKQLGALTTENLPNGIIKGHFVNFARNSIFMYILLGGE